MKAYFLVFLPLNSRSVVKCCTLMFIMSNTKELWRIFTQAFTIFAAAAAVVALFLQIVDNKPLSYRSAVSKALPSVVSIYGRDEHGAEDSLGSGVIVSSDGYIITNYHLIANLNEIEVGLKDGNSYVAQLVGIDPDIDIAVLHIEASDLPAMTSANDKHLEPGDVVFAIGNPFGLNRSTTMGIVSAIGRDRLGLHGFERFIQTDAAINPGSSGGALSDTSGKLVGINSALFYRQHGITPQGIGFAIPAGLAMSSYGRLIRKTAPAADTLGAEMRLLSRRLHTEILGESSQETLTYLLTTRIWQDSPAARNGLQVGDIVVNINGHNPQAHVADGQLLPSAHELKILRGSEKFTININDE